MELKDYLKKQYTLDSNIMHRFYKNGGNISENELLSDKILALIVETSEFANSLACFKYWKQNHNKDYDHILEEFSDILFFWLSIANLLEFNENDIEKAYMKKYEENERRIKEGY